ncbi:hypothetical protein D3C80_1327500 [compost metagenome]
MATDGFRLLVGEPAIGVKAPFVRGHPQQQHIHATVVVTGRAVLRHDGRRRAAGLVGPPGFAPGQGSRLDGGNDFVRHLLIQVGTFSTGFCQPT